MNEKNVLTGLKGIMVVEIVLIMIFFYIAITNNNICPEPNDGTIHTIPRNNGTPENEVNK